MKPMLTKREVESLHHYSDWFDYEPLLNTIESAVKLLEQWDRVYGTESSGIGDDTVAFLATYHGISDKETT